jgi:GT2 family glycosyltransferase
VGDDALTIAIPTYNRGAIVVETVHRLLRLDPPPAAILVVDQTEEATPDLAQWNEAGVIRWIRLARPSIPHAMNEALLAARTPLVLFLDDDVEPGQGIVAAHTTTHRDGAVWAVVGQILEQGERPQHHQDPRDDLDFRFNHDTARPVGNVMAGNLSVKRERALGIGGFDENFVGVAYRFETDFALRLLAAGGAIHFEPAATLRHLKLSTGGLRSYGDHKTSPSPMHSAGDYYFARQNRSDFWRYAFRRLWKNVVTRHHALHPWTIPAKLIGETRGLLLGRRLARGGRKLIPR